ncbi:MAG: alpha/beta fold hydrolase [Actinomycetota bacterium]|nr:alpha/beta fold hydrolase [Actinomycetota bacterium]
MRRLRRFRGGGGLPALALGLALVAGACSGGGGTAGAGLDAEFRPTAGERQVQFTGAAKLGIGATLALPPNAKGPVPAVLIIPAPGATNRDGPLVDRPPDPLYKDLSATLTNAGVAALRYDHRGVGASQLAADQQLGWDDMVADAKEALNFLSQRREVDASRIAVVGHDMGGTIALTLAATDSRVKSVALVSAPGRPLVDVWADGFKVNGQASVDAFRAMIDGLLATGSLPPRDSIRPEYQSLLPPGEDAFFRGMFSADPLAASRAVKVPVLIAVGERSTTVSGVDATALAGTLGGTSEVVVAANSSATLQQILPAPVRVFDPTDMDSHGLGPPVADAPREQSTVDHIALFLASSVGAHTG